MTPSPRNHNGNIVLSLHNDYYKQIMWSHYRKLGKTKDTNAELHMANTVRDIFQTKLSKTRGKYYKQAGCGNSFKHLEEIDEEMALSKIVADIKRRMKNYDAWSVGDIKEVVVDENIACKIPSKSSASKIIVDGRESIQTELKSNVPTKGVSNGKELISPLHSGENDNSVVLSLHNDYYKRIMWAHFKIIGKDRDSATEKLIAETVLDIFKKKTSSSSSNAEKSVCRSGQQCVTFYKLDKACTKMEEVNEGAALAKITADIQRRMRNYSVWSIQEGIVHETITKTTCHRHASISPDPEVAVKDTSQGSVNAKKMEIIASTSCPDGVTEQEITETLGSADDTQLPNINPRYPLSFNETIKAALDSYQNHVLLKNDNNPSPPVPPPFLSYEEECTIKTALAFVMARTRIKKKKEGLDSSSGISVKILPGFSGGVVDKNTNLCILQSPQRVKLRPALMMKTNHEMERKFKHVCDVLNLAVSSILPFYKGALEINECEASTSLGKVITAGAGTSSRERSDAISEGRKPCAVYDYEAAVQLSTTPSSGTHDQYATLDGFCRHLIERISSMIRNESLYCRLKKTSGNENKNDSFNQITETNVITDRSNTNSEVELSSAERASKISVKTTIVNLIYSSVVSNASINFGSTNSSKDAREYAEHRIEKIMAVCHVFHRLLFLDVGCCLGTECVEAIGLVLTDLYMNEFRGTNTSTKFRSLSHDDFPSIACNGGKNQNQKSNQMDSDRYQVVPSRWSYSSSSKSYITQRYDRRRRSIDDMFQRPSHVAATESVVAEHVESKSKRKSPLPRIGDVLAVNMLRLLEGAAAIRIYHHQQRVPKSTLTRRHHELMIDKTAQQAAAEVLNEIRSSINQALLLPLHVEDASSFYYSEKTRCTRIRGGLKSGKKNDKGTSDMILQPGAKIMLRLHLFNLSNKLALYE